MACTWKGQIRRDWRDSDEIKNTPERKGKLVQLQSVIQVRREKKLELPRGKGKKLIVRVIGGYPPPRRQRDHRRLYTLLMLYGLCDCTEMGIM
jgi:hypothetical protein